MAMEMKLSQQDRNLLKNLTRSLDNLAISLGKRQAQAPKSPKRLIEPYTEDCPEEQGALREVKTRRLCSYCQETPDSYCAC